MLTNSAVIKHKKKKKTLPTIKKLAKSLEKQKLNFPR